MSVVSLLNVNVKNNPAAFDAPYEFEITFECLEPLQKDLEWKLTYVGSATSSEHDQELDSLLVGPVPVGVNKFLFEADAPNLKRIPNSEILGVTVILLTCSYDGREFVRVGYYVNNEYTDEALQAEPPAKPVIEKVRRNILAEKPRVTRFAIKWDSEDSAPAEYPPEQPEADVAEDDEAAYGAEEEEEDEEATAVKAKAVKVDGEDDAMGGVEDADPLVEKNGFEPDDGASEAGSEDLEAESSGSDEEGDDEEGEGEAEGEGEGEGEGEVEGEGDEDMEMGEDSEKPAGDLDQGQSMEQQAGHQQANVMVH